MLYGTAIPPSDDDEPLIHRQSKPVPPPARSGYQTPQQPTLPPYYTGIYQLQNFVQPIIKINTTSTLTNPNSANRKPPGKSNQPPRKNGPKNKNKSNKNGNRTTTPKPDYTTIMLTYFSSNNSNVSSISYSSSINSKPTNNKQKTAGYGGRKLENESNISNVNTFGGKSTTLRPKQPQKAATPNQSVLNSISNGDANYIMHKNAKYLPSYSNVFEKASGKAPKQVRTFFDSGFFGFSISIKFYDLQMKTEKLTKTSQTRSRK